MIGTKDGNGEVLGDPSPTFQGWILRVAIVLTLLIALDLSSFATVWAIDIGDPVAVQEFEQSRETVALDLAERITEAPAETVREELDKLD